MSTHKSRERRSPSLRRTAALTRAEKPAVRAGGRRSAVVPETMLAAAIDRFGGPEVLSLHEMPVPQLDAGEVLIATHTAGVGSWDADIRDGWTPDGRRPRFPLVLGTDGSGTVVAVGSRIRRFAVGDEVYAYSFFNPKGGFYAEYVAVAAEHVALVPAALDMKQAGAAATTALTALQGVDHALRIRRGESVIVLGASGAVGTLAVQFAKLRGARVLAIASGRDGVALARRLGADAAVDGKTGDVAAVARRFAPDGVDAVLAFAGGDALACAVEALRRGGRLAHPNGVEHVPRKRRGTEKVTYDAEAGVREFARLERAIDAAHLVVPIGAEFPLAAAARAHARLAEGHVRGKMVLRVRS